jgi:hypothetical protein
MTSGYAARDEGEERGLFSVRRVVGRPLGKVPQGSYFHETAGIWCREGGSSHLMGHAFMRKYQELRESRKCIF